MYKKVCDFVYNTHTICTNFERIEFNFLSSTYKCNFLGADNKQ